jgi:hypothetical protein
VLDGHLVSAGGFGAIGGTNHQQVGDGPQGGDGFHGLVGGAVFAQTDGVVGHHIDHPSLGEGRDADGARM